MPSKTIPQPIEEALRRVLDYLWVDEAAHCLETSPLEGRSEHIFHSLVEIRAWLDHHAPNSEDESHGEGEED